MVLPFADRTTAVDERSNVGMLHGDIGCDGAEL